MEYTLEQRMARHVIGKVTWPDLNSDKRCVSCRYYSTGTVSEKRKGEGFGVFALVKVHTRNIGKQFKGEQAIACSKWC